MSNTSPGASPIEQLLGSTAPKLVQLTDDVLFGDVWKRPELSPRDRSLITIASLVTGGNIPQLDAHVPLGLTNGLTEEEVVEVITHIAFYAGWPKAISALVAVGGILDSLEGEAP